MAKGNYKRSARSENDNNVGCVWGLIRMLYFRRDPKYLLDRKPRSRRHYTRHQKHKLRSTEETDDDDDNKEHNVERSTVKKLIEEDLDRVKPLKKIPTEEVERILSDLGHDVRLDNDSRQTRGKSKVVSDGDANDLAAPVPGTSNSNGWVNWPEENDLEFVLADFLVEIYRYHNQCQHVDCKNMSELCPALKSLIHKKLNDLNNASSNDGGAREGNENELLDEKHLNSSKAAQSKEFMDALEILSSNKELFLKLLQKPSLHILKNIQNHQSRKSRVKLEPGNDVCITQHVQDISSSDQCQELSSSKRDSKESRFSFFRRNDKSNSRQTSEGTDSAQLISRIVILKPSPGRLGNPMVTTSPSSLHQQPCSMQAPEHGDRVPSNFSFKEIRRRFRLVTGENQKAKTSINEHQKEPHWFKDSAIAVRQFPGKLSGTNLTCLSSSDAQSTSRPPTREKQKKNSGCKADINNDINPCEAGSFLYEETKKHLTEILRDTNEIVNVPDVHVSKSLEGMLALPECNVLSPTSSLAKDEDLDQSSPKETKFPLEQQFQKEECAEAVRQSNSNAGSIACTTSVDANETQMNHSEVQEWQCMEEEKDQEDNWIFKRATDAVDELHIERPSKIGCCSKSFDDKCCISSGTLGENKLLEMIDEPELVKELMTTCASSPESNTERLEQPDHESPEPSASSPSSSESNREKQDHPSPVSVLEPFFCEDIDNTDGEITIPSALLDSPPLLLRFPNRQILVDEIVRFEYIKSVLEISGLCTDTNAERWYLADQLLDSSLFHDIETQYDHEDLKILFDCICQVLIEIQQRHFKFSPWTFFSRYSIQSPPLGQNLIPEVSRIVDKHFQNQLPSTLENLVGKHMECETWMHLHSESESIVYEMWDSILDDLVDEVAFDLWIDT